MESPLIQVAAQWVRRTFENESSGHDWWHIHRVWKMAARIATAEGADQQVVQLAALLHDIADWKFHDGDLSAGPRAARKWLEEQATAPRLTDQVCEIIAGISYKGAGVATPMSSLEGRVVQDADRLDAIGAIGVARAFAYGGHAGRLLHDPEHPPTLHMTAEAYHRDRGPTTNHFYEKLLLLKDRMQTATGREIAQQRHAYLEGFLEQFLAEWDARA